MPNDPPITVPDAAIARKPLLSPRVRLIVAWIVTLAVMPYAAARVLAFALINGTPELRFVGLLAAALFAVAGLTFGLSQSFRETRLPGLMVWLILIPWVVIIAVLVSLFNGGVLPWQVVALVFTGATIWVAWAGWMHFYTISTARRLGILLALVMLAVAALMSLRIDGLSGDNHLNFTWRWTKRPTPVIVDPQASGVAELIPTPDDYAQFLGPHRLGILPNAYPVADWKGTPPREVWRRGVGLGWSSFAVVGNFAVTLEQREQDECVCCYRISDGEPVWVHRDSIRFDSNLGGSGPRATPTISAGRVFAVGATGLLNCLDGSTGRRIWSVNILEDHQAENISHGVCASPLVVDGMVIVCPTGSNGISLAAYHCDDGRRLWQGGKDQASYGSPLLVDLKGVRQVLLYTAQGVTGHDLATGQVLWSFPWTNSEHVNASQPVPIPGSEGDFLISTGYGRGSARIRVSRNPEGSWSAEPVWENRKPVMQAKFTTPVFFNGFVYGLDNGILACVEPETGKRRWIDGRYGHGQILLAKDKLIVQMENGRLVLVAPSPDGLEEQGRVNAMDGKTWNNPTIAGRFLLVRNDREAVCYELRE